MFDVIPPWRPKTGVPLSDATLRLHSQRVDVPTYDRSALQRGVVHIGAGNFHRAHQAVYFDDLARSGISDRWGVTGVSLNSSNAKDLLSAQDGLYTVVQRGHDRQTARVVGSIGSVHYAPNDGAAVRAALADPQTRVVSLTITDNGYFLALPSMAATAWYHHRVPNQPATLEPLLKEVEQFSLGAYATALLQGAELPDAQKKDVAAKLESYTGVPVAYWIKANLRVSGGEFSKELQSEMGITTGRLDTRYEGPDLDPLSEEAGYDPFGSATSSAYNTAINQYSRDTLKYGENLTYKPSAREPGGFNWDLKHVPPGMGQGWDDSSVNVMPDLAMAMKRNPKLKVLLMGGYYDLGCTYFGATYEDKHLQIPQSLQSNINYHFFQTGHMVYITTPALKELHDATADFIKNTEDGGK